MSRSLDRLSRQVEAVERWLDIGADGAAPELAGPAVHQLPELSESERGVAEALRARIDRCVQRMAGMRDEVSGELDSSGQRRSVARRYLVHEQGR
jgi:hypothetical protein